LLIKNEATQIIHLQEGNEIVSSPSRTCKIFNKAIVEMGNKLILDNNLNQAQTSNNIVNLKDSFVLLEIESDVIKTIHGMNNKKSARLDDISPNLLKKLNLTR
jgi:hypothetical protein